jgi:mono/diheme cytochrome c family protein
MLPREVVPAQEGVLLRFDVELSAPVATGLANYSVERWNYRRSPAYGSPHYRLDGSKGQDRMYPSSVYLSRDRRSVFIGLPDMRAGVMQMQVGWRLAAADGTWFENVAHFTPFVLGAFNPAAEGFEAVTVDLTPRAPPATEIAGAATLAEGEKLSQTIGCIACHTTSGMAQLGPTWRGLFGSRRRFADESSATADEAYLRESILNPMARVVPGFEAPMPGYAGILNERQVESLVLYIKTLQ